MAEFRFRFSHTFFTRECDLLWIFPVISFNFIHKLSTVWINRELIYYLKYFSDYIDVAFYRKTKKGGFKLVHNGYEYYKQERTLDGIQAWRCINFTGCQSAKCNVRAYTRNFGMVDRVRVNGFHMHYPRDIKASCILIRLIHIENCTLELIKELLKLSISRAFLLHLVRHHSFAPV